MVLTRHGAVLQFAEKNAQISNFYWIARDTMFRGP